MYLKEEFLKTFLNRSKKYEENHYKENNKYNQNYLFVIFILIYMSPLIVTFTNSFMTKREINENYGLVKTIFETDKGYVDMNLIPDPVSLEEYKIIFFDTPVYLNSFGIP